MSNKDLADNEHLQERGYLVQKEHPEFGKRVHAGIPWQMSGSRCEVQSSAPQRGQHTNYVLGELLGYEEEEIKGMRDDGVLT